VEGYNKILYSEELNKKTKIQNMVQTTKYKNEEDQKFDYSIINKHNPDIALNINKYIDDDHLLKTRKAIYSQIKHYFNFLKNQNEIEKINSSTLSSSSSSSKKKKVFRIKKKSNNNSEILNSQENLDFDNKKNINNNIFLKYLYENKHFSIIATIRKSSLIKLYGIILGNYIYEKIFRKD
jgi:hypothetical protein